MNKFIYPLSLFLFICSCNSSPILKKEIPKYNFSHNSITSEASLTCQEDLVDAGFIKMNELESMLLEGVGQLLSIDSDVEIEAGNEIHNGIKGSVVDDHRLKRVQKILSKMLNHVQRKKLNYEIFIIEEDMVNAFAIPGGRMYITTGMLDYVKNDDELANVIGHEIGHNENEHTAKLVRRMAPAMLFGDIGAVIVNIFSKATIPFNQPDEIEADMSGFYLSYKAGYDPEVGLEFWKRMAADENPNAIEKLFRSHPYSEVRYKCGKEHLEGMKVTR